MRGGPRSFRQGFSCPGVLRIPPRCSALRVRGFHPLWPAFPKPFRSRLTPFRRSIPRSAMRPGLGSSGFARRYSRNRCFFLFLRLLRCFSSPGSPPDVMDSRPDARVFPARVSPFRHPRIFGHLPLPAAFRSLSRLSSAPSAKASAPRPFCLTSFGFWLPHSVAAPFFLPCLFLFLGYLKVCVSRFFSFSVWSFQGAPPAVFLRPPRRPICSGAPAAGLIRALLLFFFFLFRLAASCFPAPSPAQYHRPPAS